MDAAEYTALAKQARGSASGASTRDVARALGQLADGYEAKAARLAAIIAAGVAAGAAGAAAGAAGAAAGAAGAAVAAAGITGITAAIVEAAAAARTAASRSDQAVRKAEEANIQARIATAAVVDGGDGDVLPSTSRLCA